MIHMRTLSRLTAYYLLKKLKQMSFILFLYYQCNFYVNKSINVNNKSFSSQKPFQIRHYRRKEVQASRYQ